MAPLKAINGVAFATLVSGPPSVPDELLEMLCNQAGPLLERVWKEEKACEAVEQVMRFIKQSSVSHHQLVYVKFDKGKEQTRRNADREAWEWQALEQYDVGWSNRWFITCVIAQPSPLLYPCLPLYLLPLPSASEGL